MVERVPFIGREIELAKIAQLLQAHGEKQVVCIHGPGGIGKTRLLEEIKRLYSLQPQIVVTEVMDFDDLALHIPENVELRIAQALGQKAFQPYLQELQRLNSMEIHGMDALTLDNQSDLAHTTFVENFNQVTKTCRVVLLFDTTERLKEQHVWDDFRRLVKTARNTLFVLAGRNTANIYQELLAKEDLEQPDRQAILVNLEALQQQDSNAYLANKQQLLHITLAPELSAALLSLAQGRPILLDLATEYLAHHIPLPWLLEVDAQGSQTRPEQDWSNFETALALQLEQMRRPLDRLTLALSRIHPLDTEGIVTLLRLPPDEADELYQEACNYAFIKQLPGGKISLHDEMRRMINEQVWPNVDPDQGRRRRDSKLAVEYLSRRLATLDAAIKNLPFSATGGQNAAPPQSELSEFVQREALARERWALTEHLISHALYANLNDGFARFCQLFDEAEHFHRITLRAMILEQIEPYTAVLSLEQSIVLEMRKILQAIDLGEYDQARQMAIRLLRRGVLKADQRLDVLTRLANSQKLLGHHKEAAVAFEEALQICHLTPELRGWEGAMLNSLGLVYREMGQLDMALEYYTQALSITFDAAQMASALNNIGYVWALQGKYRSAAKYCEQALAIRQQYHRQREIGMSYSTLGELYRNWGKYDEALQYYNIALDIFEAEHDLLWLARVRNYRGAICRLKEQYEQAAAELKQSIQYNIKIEQPWAYHALGCVYWNQGNLSEALNCFATSQTLAIEIHDIRSQVNNLVGSAEVYYDLWLQSNREDAQLTRQIHEKAEALEALVGQGYKHHTGRMQRVLADIAYDMSDYDRAFQLYKTAYAGLGSRSGGYGKRKFSDELDLLAQKLIVLAQTNPQQVIRWCKDFRRAWSDHEILRSDELLTMCDVCEVEARLRLHPTS